MAIPAPLVDISESIQIDTAADVVWALVTDVKRHPEFAGPKSITKVIDFDGLPHVGDRWIAHERFGPQKFDAPSDVIKVNPDREFAWVSYPPFKEDKRGEGGRVFWSYTLAPAVGGTHLTHKMQVIPPERGALGMKVMYAVLGLPKKQRAGIITTLDAIKAAAEAETSFRPDTDG